MFSDIDFLQKILDNIQEGMLLLNKDGAIIGCNNKATAILELSKEELLGSHSLHPHWEQVNSSGEPVSAEKLPTAVTKNTGKIQKDVILGLRVSEKNIKWLNINTQKLTHQTVDYTLATFTDITEKYNLQQEAKVARDRLKYALKGSDLAVWDYNVITQELYLSEEWRAILGYGLGKIENGMAHWETLIHPEDKSFVLKNISDCLSFITPGFKMEYRLLGNDGDYKWILSTGKVISKTEEGTPLRFSGTIKDITERKVIEELVKANEEKFKNAFQFSAIGMALVSPEGNWIDVNPALCQMLGYTKEELSALTFQDVTHPDDLSIDLHYVNQMLNRQIETYSMEKRYFHKNGSIVWVLLTVSLMWRDTDAKLFISQIVDITASKALMIQVEAKNAQLNLTTIDLKNKIEQLEEFNRIVAHNLRGPVGNLLMLGDMLAEDKESADLYVDMLKEASGGLDNTLRELIKILEIKLNKDIAQQTCSFDEIISKVLKMLNASIQNENIIFDTDLAVTHLQYPTVYLESILYNLITNSIKYRRKTVQSEVHINTYKENGRVVLEVSDNGLGIDLKRYGHQVFKLNKFFHKGYDSKGLGLFILKNQVETLGGNISVESEPDQGSKFKVVF